MLFVQAVSMAGEPIPSREGARRARDATLSRLVRTRRGVFLSAAALTAAVAAYISSAAPGRSATSTARATPTGSSASVSSKTMPPLASPQSLGLAGGGDDQQAAPAPAPPAPSAAAPPADSSGPAVVSGGS